MKYYKLEDETVRAIGEENDIDGDQSFLVQENWVLMTEEEYQLFINPPKTPEQIKEEHNAPILAQIQAIKIDLNVPIMKLTVGTDQEKIEAAQALKDYNTQITALEAQLL